VFCGISVLQFREEEDDPAQTVSVINGPEPNVDDDLMAQ
jgi:hypothetical protein